MSPALEIPKRQRVGSDGRRHALATNSLTRRVAADWRLPQMLRAWALSYGALWAFTLGGAVLVTFVPGAPMIAREVLRLSLDASHNPPPSLGVVVSIAANNVLHAAWPLLLGLVGAERRWFTRRLADGAVLANLLFAGLLVGVAVGGYGTRVLPFLVHVPLEWAGIAAGSAGWVIERNKQLDGRRLTVALTALLLLCAATAETCLVPHR